MGVDLGALRKKLEELKTGQKQMEGEFMDRFLQVPEGETVLRILPGKDGGQFYSETAIHRMNDKNLHCPGRSVCPLCRYVSKLFNSKDEKMTQIARGIKAKKRFYFNVIAREARNPTTGEIEKNVGPKIYSCGIKLFEKILSTFVDDDFGDLTDLKEGWDFKIVKKEKDGYPNYDDSRPRPKSCPASEDEEEIKRWMEGLHDLQALIVKKTPEELQEELDQFVARESIENPELSRIATMVIPQKTETKPAAEVNNPVQSQKQEDPFDSSSGDESDDFIAQLKEMSKRKK